MKHFPNAVKYLVSAALLTISGFSLIFATSTPIGNYHVDEYLLSVEKQVLDYNDKVAELREKLKQTPRNTDQYADLDKKLSKMENKTEDLRENLSDFKNAISKEMERYQAKINSDLAELQRTDFGQ